MNPETEADGSAVVGFPEVPSRWVAGRAPSDPGAAFLSASCLFFLGIWAQSSRR
jgi:hypothetical protein